MIIVSIFQIVIVNILFLLNFKINMSTKDVVMMQIFYTANVNFCPNTSLTISPPAPTPQHCNWKMIQNLHPLTNGHPLLITIIFYLA